MHSQQQGMTLVELMISMVLGLLLSLAIGTLFVQSKRSYNQNERISVMQDNARYALQSLSNDLVMAGYYGGILDAGKIDISHSSLNIGTANDCGPGTDAVAGWAFDVATPLEFYDHGELTINTTYGCIDDEDYDNGSDVLTIRRVSGIVTASDQGSGLVCEDGSASCTLTPNTFYLVSNGASGALFKTDASGGVPSGVAKPAPPIDYWQYITRVYYIANTNNPDGTGNAIPTLCREYLPSATVASQVTVECIAEGIERLQIYFGIDTIESDGSDTYDSVPNTYVEDPTTAQLSNAVTAHVQMVVRSLVVDSQYTNNKVYTFAAGGGTISGNGDRYYRRMYNTTVAMNNPLIQRGLNPGAAAGGG